MKKWVYSILSIFLLASCTLPWNNRVETSPIVTLFVGSERVFCDNPLRNNLCYQVKAKLEDDWELYKGEIMGLQYSPDFLYELQVQKDSLSVLSENAPEQQWVLIKTIQKVPVTGEGLDEKNELNGSVWVLDQFGSPQTLHTATGAMIPTLHFQQDGHFTGSTGCNRFNGTYSTENQQIAFSSVAVTKKMCQGENGMLEQEQSILKIIELADKYKFENNKLLIFSEADAQVLIYKK
jgi:heat shock protein HslJ